jgi:hypothetical protein
MQPGAGYQAYLVSTEAQTLFYSEPDTGRILAENVRPYQVSQNFSFVETGMPYIVAVEDATIDDDMIELEAGDEIALFDGEVCVGGTVFDGEYPFVVTAWQGSDEYGLPGFIPGNVISARVYLEDFGVEFAMDVSAAEEQDLYYQGSNYSVVSLHGSSGLATTVSYSGGWNLLGLPREVEDASFSVLFPNADEGSLYSFDGGTYQEEMELTAGDGYWLRFSDEGASAIIGFPFSEITVSLDEGWNMIAGISHPGFVFDPDNIIVPGTLYGYDAETSYTYSETLEPGAGYWVCTSASGDITINDGNLSRQENSEFVNRLEGANTLEFIDTEDRTRTLYFYADIPDAERLSYSLPPVPPEGAFDIRFSGGWRYTGETGMVEIRAVTYPMTIQYNASVTPPRMQWVLEAGPDVWILEGETGEVTIDSPVDGLMLKMESMVPEEFSLKQNYPNPFNPVTTIMYQLPVESQVRLVIYNVLGQEVKTLVNRIQSHGWYEVNWDGMSGDGTPAGSGLYIYRIEADGMGAKAKSTFLQHRKMILLK